MDHTPKNVNKEIPQLEPSQLRDFFTNQLNYIFCAKSHLAERLPDMAGQADFNDLKYAIMETCEGIERQILRITEIYNLLDKKPELENCDGLIAFIEDGFNGIYIQRGKPGLRDLAILFYLSIIESIEVTTFRTLQIIATKFPAEVQQ